MKGKRRKEIEGKKGKENKGDEIKIYDGKVKIRRKIRGGGGKVIRCRGEMCEIR